MTVFVKPEDGDSIRNDNVVVGYYKNYAIVRNEYNQYFYLYGKPNEVELGTVIENKYLMIQKIDDMLSSVYSTYNDIVEDLNKSIEKYVPQERLLEYQKNNEVSHEQLPKKDIDVAPEMDMDYDLEM